MKQHLFSRRNNPNKNSRHLICPLKLKGIPVIILEKFRITIDNLDQSIEKALEYLSSKELDEIKFGAFLFRRFFSEIVSEEDKFNNIEQNLIFYIDPFIDKGIINIIGKVLITESNYDIISELTWTLLNLTNYGTKKSGYKYIKEFISPTYIEIFYKIINIGDNEISHHLFEFLSNCILESTDFAKNLFANENFIRLCVNKYLEPAKSIKIEQDVKKSIIYFFVCLSRINNIFNEKQKNLFYKIYEKLIEVRNFEPIIILYAILGLRYIFCNDKSDNKFIFNIIKKNNYDIFDKLILSLKEILTCSEYFDIDMIAYNILKFINHFIDISEEKDIIILLQNTKLLSFIEAFYSQIFFKSVKIELLGVLELLSRHTSNVVITMIKGRDKLIGEVIKGTLNSNNFDIKMKGILIIYNMLSLNSLDINIILFKYGILDYLISVNLLKEIDSDCLTKILNGIIFFINSIKPLEHQWKLEIINNLIKIGITNGLENNNVRFNEEHNLIINQIKTDITNILNYDDINKSSSTPNNNINNLVMFDNQKKMISIGNSVNPFLNMKNNNINGINGMSLHANNENIQNEANPY